MNSIISDAYLRNYFVDSPIRMVDVGASEGFQSDWVNLGPHVHFIGFEPHEPSYQKLLKNKKDNQSIFNHCLYDEKTTVQFHVTRKEDASSILRPNTEIISKYAIANRFDIIERLNMQSDTLDNVLLSHDISDVDFIKLDTQGTELNILKGGKTLLESAIGVDVEVGFSPFYENQPLFGDVNVFMADNGFSLIDIHHLARYTRDPNIECRGQLLGGNALYMKNMEHFFDAYKGELLKVKLLKYMVVCLIFKLHDLAHVVFEKFIDVFSKKDVQILSSILREFSRKRSHKFAGKRLKFSMFLYNLADKINPPPSSKRAHLSKRILN